ncbi:Chromate transporter [Mycoplasmopsis maculosa]|uniref:Chromate transporter n=1 Tax=Mycoplasmopsis maculosa TaxID=114885 RepID=A0A449B4N3_9BACT|nr:chromate transporter [Mycoplasmopsis maculosa]VEU75552.1 Chromate transporter [Mycoplasmopsis maculosa]
MTLFLLLLFTIGLTIVISLSVFGGGQIFMPIYRQFWSLLNTLFNTNISENDISNIFTLSNSTPGVFSTKLAFVTGYYVANGEWWGFIFMFITYLSFILVPILIMYFAMKLSQKSKNSVYGKKLLAIMNPIISAIMAALVIQLLIGIIAPYFVFNKSINDYFKIDENNSKALFFSGFRKIALFIFVPTGIISSAILYKFKFPLLAILFINVISSFIIFAPWA